MARPAPEPWTNRTPKSTNLKAKTLILVGEGHRDAWHVRVPCLFFLFKNNSANSEYIENSD